MRLSEFPTYAPLGQFNMPVAMRTNVSGNMEAPATVFWNVKKGLAACRSPRGGFVERSTTRQTSIRSSRAPVGDTRGVGSVRPKRSAAVARALHPPAVTNRRTSWPIINTLKKQGLIVTAFWEAKPGEVDALVGIIKKFLPQAQAEPGVLAFQIHQSLTEPTKFFFYEVFKDEAAFAEHARPRTSRP